MDHLWPVLVLAMLLSPLALSAEPESFRDAGGEVVKGLILKHVTLGGEQIEYVVFVPASYDPKTPAPTIVYLHGMQGSGTDGFKPISYGLAYSVLKDVERWPFIIIFPQKHKVDALWEAYDPMVMAIIEKTKRECNVDRSRMYLTGISQGGHGTWSIAALHPDMFAAIVPMAGWGDEDIAEKLAKARIPIWCFHGEDDVTCSVEESRKMERWIREAGGSCKLTVYPNTGHYVWDKAYGEEKLYDWFLQHHR